MSHILVGVAKDSFFGIRLMSYIHSWNSLLSTKRRLEVPVARKKFNVKLLPMKKTPRFVKPRLITAAELRKMSKAQVRVVIVKDVLTQLRQEKLIATRGSYLGLDKPNRGLLDKL